MLEYRGAVAFKVVDELTYRIEPSGPAAEVWLHDMTLARADGAPVDLEALKPRLEACFMAVMRGRAENDGYNALVLEAGLPWRDVALVRTLSRFLRQARVAYSQDYMWATLRKHAAVAADIVALFHTRFDPRGETANEARRVLWVQKAQPGRRVPPVPPARAGDSRPSRP